MNGVLPKARQAREQGCCSWLVPAVALIEDIGVYPEPTLAARAAKVRGYQYIEPYRPTSELDADPPAYAADFSDIKG